METKYLLYIHVDIDGICVICTIMTVKMKAEIRLATAKTRTVALTAKQTAAPPRVVMNSVEQYSRNFTKSNRSPSQ